MAGRGREVPRPARSTEYILVFGNNAAKKGWNDLRSGARNALVDAWEHLTLHPEQQSRRCYPLRGTELGQAVFEGHAYTQWQYKITGGGRIWYIVVPAEHGEKRAGTIVLIRCSTKHPKETDR